jgi:hypothetical protein
VTSLTKYEAKEHVVVQIPLTASFVRDALGEAIGRTRTFKLSTSDLGAIAEVATTILFHERAFERALERAGCEYGTRIGQPYDHHHCPEGS